MNVRRLAAIDMWGVRGTTRRRRIILTEFIVGVVALIGWGLWLVGGAHTSVDRVFGAYLVLTGLNYVPLALYAIAFSRPGRLDAELVGVDTLQELRRYTFLQFWVFVPLSFVVLAGRDALTRRR